MPGGRAWCPPHVRRHVAIQRRDDRSCAEIRLQLRAATRRLEAGAFRKTNRSCAAGNSLRELAARGARERGKRGGPKRLISLDRFAGARDDGQELRFVIARSNATQQSRSSYFCETS